jgi:hypothetical protein
MIVKESDSAGAQRRRCCATANGHDGQIDICLRRRPVGDRDVHGLPEATKVSIVMMESIEEFIEEPIDESIKESIEK